jgi:hypothetical protein
MYLLPHVCIKNIFDLLMVEKGKGEIMDRIPTILTYKGARVSWLGSYGSWIYN